ncbi:hypothetical protein CAPTEDRAFT_217714 [Capitella teleta]|uniref:Uncharacterized protein n=1 Tax=Capitella teleta TaxID=283909 RepID=X2AMK5_CAPTE|nr:hypothetical protein CAPTEDRAFT_217714 [Capitella teleta]|eukprot:ELU00329.1 hypothetical protein CAPTEDRAFT_217714 [Capitella teleta]
MTLLSRKLRQSRSKSKGFFIALSLQTLSLLPFVCFDDCLAMPIEKLCSQVGRLPPLPRDMALTWSPSAERKKPLPPIQRKKEPLSSEHFLIPYQPSVEVSGPLLSPCGDSSAASTDSSSLTCVSALSSPSEASSSASSVPEFPSAPACSSATNWTSSTQSASSPNPACTSSEAEAPGDCMPQAPVLASAREPWQDDRIPAHAERASCHEEAALLEASVVETGNNPGTKTEKRSCLEERLKKAQEVKIKTWIMEGTVTVRNGQCDTLKIGIPFSADGSNRLLRMQAQQFRMQPKRQIRLSADIFSDNTLAVGQFLDTSNLRGFKSRFLLAFDFIPS